MSSLSVGKRRLEGLPWATRATPSSQGRRASVLRMTHQRKRQQRSTQASHPWLPNELWSSWKALLLRAELFVCTHACTRPVFIGLKSTQKKLAYMQGIINRLDHSVGTMFDRWLCLLHNLLVVLICHALAFVV